MYYTDTTSYHVCDITTNKRLITISLLDIKWTFDIKLMWKQLQQNQYILSNSTKFICRSEHI